MTGIELFNAPTDDLPPLTRAVRESWGIHAPHPVASAAAMEALFLAVYELETQLAAVGNG